MKEVAPTIVLKAKKCDINHFCLKEDGTPACTIESCINNCVLFLDKLERDCCYNQEFGYNHVCLCPVRRELFMKYKV